MIVNSRMENHNNLQQQIHINSSNDCENFYLKRKYDSLILDTINDNNNDVIDDDDQSSSTLVYIQPKKRHLLNFTSINNGVDDTTITNESVDVIATTETTTKSLSSLATGTIATTVFNDNHENDHHHQHPCEITTTYNLNNELDNSFTNHCQNIADFLNYENTLITSTSPPSVSSASQSQSLQSSLSSSSSSIINHIQNPIYITSSSINDTTNWQNSDLLELDHRYNSINISNLNDNQIIQLDNNNKSPSPRQQHQHQHKQQQQQQQQQHQEQHQQQITMNTTTSQTDSDFEDKNLSWLFNFKLDELPNLSPSEVNRCSVSINNHSNNCNNKLSTVLSSSSSSSLTTLLAANQLSSSSTTVPGTITTLSSPSSLEAITTNRNQSSKTATGRKVDELILEVTSSECYENDIIAVGENVIVENNTTRTPKKPPFTYTELIEYALEDKRELTVSGIYQWISDRFPFYKSNDDRWKNSVRHNLSINPHFRKGIKAPQGAGHLWTISSRDSEENTLAWEHKKQRLELFFRMENSSQQKLNNNNNNNINNNNNGSSNNNTANSIIENQSESNNSAIYDEAATAAANIVQQLRNEENSSVSSPKLEQQQQQQQHHNLSSQTLSITTTNSITNNHDHNDNHHHHHHHPHHHHESSTTAEQILTEISDEDLQKAAGEILNGVRRNVEVQSLETLHSSDISTYHDNLLHTGIGGDYLNPINKYDAVAESGLRHRSLDIANEFYVTEIDPIELGINMSNVEEEVLFSDEFNLNYFGINPNSDIVA